MMELSNEMRVFNGSIKDISMCTKYVFTFRSAARSRRYWFIDLYSYVEISGNKGNKSLGSNCLEF